MINRSQDLSFVKDAAVESTLKTLRDQRDLRQEQHSFGIYEVNPQIFKNVKHFVDGPIYFKVPFQTTPTITFGQIAQRATENITKDIQSLTAGPTAYEPLIIDPYVFGFDQDSGGIKAFYLALYARTNVPLSSTRYVIGWRADGKGVSYPQQTIDEAWSSSYDKNVSEHLLDDTGEIDTQ